MATVRLTEAFTFSGGKVRRPGVDGYTGAYPIIEGALLCGKKSANKRRYLPEAFAGTRVNRYGNRPVFLNHGKSRESRQYQDKIASVENERTRDDGMPVADLAINPKHPFAEAFMWDAEHKPNSCGMSHVAHCETRVASDGWTEVTEVVEVESVDVVVDPATTNGLRENRGDRPMATTLRKFLEAHNATFKDTDTQKRARKMLVEMDDGSSPMPADMPMDEPSDGGDAEDALWSGFQGAMTTILESYKEGKTDAAAAAKEIGKYLKAHAKLTTGKDDAATPAEPDADDKSKESKKPSLGAILSECEKANLKTPSGKLLAALCEITDPATRLGLIEEARSTAKPGETPSSAARSPGSGGVRRTNEAAREPLVPTDKKKFFESITN